jgi:hypothetical protein
MSKNTEITNTEELENVVAKKKRVIKQVKVKNMLKNRLYLDHLRFKPEETLTIGDNLLDLPRFQHAIKLKVLKLVA